MQAYIVIHGTETFEDGSSYVGEFNEGKFHGAGTLTCSDGTKYEVEFKDGNFYHKEILNDQDGGIIQTLPDGEVHELEDEEDGVPLKKVKSNETLIIGSKMKILRGKKSKN